MPSGKGTLPEAMSTLNDIAIRTRPQWIEHIQHTVGRCSHYDDVIMGAMASHITSLTMVYSTVYSGADQSKHQSSAALAFVWGIYRGPVNPPHKWPVTRKMFPFDDVIMVPTTYPHGVIMFHLVPCGCIISSCGFTWWIYLYSQWVIHWHWAFVPPGNCMK